MARPSFVNVAIIGGTGVGMAHAIACSRLGYHVHAIVDTDKKAADERYCRGKWENIWGPYEDRFANAYAPNIYETPEEMFESDIFSDLIIISTPSDTHIDLLERMMPYYDHFRHVICEKPMSHRCEGVEDLISAWGMDFLNTKVSVGYKWLYHPGWYKAANRALTHDVFHIEQGHPYPDLGNWKMDLSVIWDLGIHAIAHIFKITEKQKACDWSIWHCKDNLELHQASLRMGLSAGNPYATIYTAYEDFKSSNGVGGESIIADVPLAWIDLFDIQIDQVVRGNRRANFEFGYEVDKLAKRWEDLSE